jgi:ABC-type oligopeptide transport system ATPase subunit
MADTEHPKSVLIVGESGAGKSVSLRNLRNQEGVLYLNAEGGKPLPFKNKFKRITIDDPYEVYEYLQAVADDPKKRIHTVVIDTASFLMERFEMVHVNGAANTMKAWGDYGAYFRTLMYDYVAKVDAYVIFLAHVDGELNEETQQMKYSVPVKGALKKNGLEAYFTTILGCRKVKIKDIEKESKEGDLLKITDRDRNLGFKHVFQTQTSKSTVGDRIRSPFGLFPEDMTYIENDVQIVLDQLKEYYED